MSRFNFTQDVVDRLASERADDEALRAIGRGGELRSYTFTEVARQASETAAGLAAAGVGRGDVVMTLMGARPEWVFAMLGAWRLGALVLPCSEQLRAKDISLRMERAAPTLVLAAGADMAEVERAARATESPPRLIDVDADGVPTCNGSVGSRHRRRRSCAGDLHVRHGGRAPRCGPHTGLPARPVGAGAALARAASRRALLVHRRERMVQVGPQRVRRAVDGGRGLPAARRALRPGGAPRDRRRARCRRALPVADRVPHDRQAHLARAAGLPALRRLVSAGEPLNPEVMEVFRAAMELDIHDGYGQTETGQLTGMPAGEPVRPGLDGHAAARLRARRRGRARTAGRRRRAVPRSRRPCRPSSAATSGSEPFARPRVAHRRSRAARRRRLPVVRGTARRRDPVRRLPDRPVRGRVRPVEHPAVAEAAAVAAPDAERGAVVDGRRGAARRARRRRRGLCRSYRSTSKRSTAPYKYPRIVRFRRRAAEDGQREDQAGGAASCGAAVRKPAARLDLLRGVRPEAP